MSDANNSKKPIKDRIDASQAQLDQESRQLAEIPTHPIPGEVNSTDDWRSKAKQHSVGSTFTYFMQCKA